jgi:hypothetical protein
MAASGFSVNHADRNDVVAFWHAVYQASEGYENRIHWTGNYSGNNGTVADAFVDDVARRLNYFRAMCGLPADATVNTDSKVVINSSDAFKPSASTLKSTAAQDAALMLARNYNPSNGSNLAFTHTPSSNLIGWSVAAWNAASNGNLGFGVYGPGAITEYMIERLSGGVSTSSWNTQVGHRRWNLYPKATTFATGDQPGTANFETPPMNVFYVIPNSSELREDPAPDFVTYPAAGFCPVNINANFWSLSRAGADFSNASVRMTDSQGLAVPIKSLSRSNGYGDPALIWEVGDAAAVESTYNDTLFNVRVSGIAGTGIPASYNYSVTLINPDRLTSNQAISGPATLRPNQSGSFTFTPPAGAESLRVGTFLKKSTAWKENAEVPASAKVIDGTAASYSLMVKPSSIQGFGTVAGTTSFRLTFPVGFDIIKRAVPEQWFELNRDIIANSKAKLNFQFRRGYMSTSSTLVVEMSSNGGVTWKALGPPIKGVSNTKFDLAVTTTSRQLPSSSTPIRIRFRYFASNGSIYTHQDAPKSPTGIFIDEIACTGCSWLVPKKVSTLSAVATGFIFNSATAGSTLVGGSKWYLMQRAKLGGKWFPYGPLKSVSIVAP